MPAHVVADFKFPPTRVVTLRAADASLLRPDYTVPAINHEVVGADGRLLLEGGSEWGLFDWGISDWSPPGSEVVAGQAYWLTGVDNDNQLLEVRLVAVDIATEPPRPQPPVVGIPWPRPAPRIGRL